MIDAGRGLAVIGHRGASMSATKLVFALCAASLAVGCGNDIDPGGGGGDDDGFTPDPPAIYVAKVKNILVGQPPTDVEIAAVTADPGALRGLIDGWMTLPE